MEKLFHAREDFFQLISTLHNVVEAKVIGKYLPIGPCESTKTIANVLARESDIIFF